MTKRRKSKFEQGGYIHPARMPGNSGPWTRFRARFLHRNPLCVKCGAAANVVDHIVPLRYKTAKLEDLIDVRNCQAMCAACHDAKTASENYRGPRFCLCGYPTEEGAATCGKTKCSDWIKEKLQAPPQGDK